MIRYLDFLFGNFYRRPSAISEHPFTEMSFSVSKTPRLTHPSFHLYLKLGRLAFFVVISCLRNRRALSPGGPCTGTWATNCALLQGQNKIPSIDGHPHCPAKLSHLERNLAPVAMWQILSSEFFWSSPFPAQCIFSTLSFLFLNFFSCLYLLWVVCQGSLNRPPLLHS